MTLLRGDKVILIKQFESLKLVGEVFEVAAINGNTIVLRDITTKVAVGAIDIDCFEEYFKTVDAFKGWTCWQHILDTDGSILGFYRTNQKKVQVKTLSDVKGEACCNKLDEFKLYFGIRLAYMRCVEANLNKEYSDIYTKYKELYAKMESVAKNIEENKNRMKNMIDSLGK